MSVHNLSGIKPAPFWLDDPPLWFAQTEAQFWYFNVIEDLTKFNYVVSQLNKHCLTVIKDLVLSPPALNKYETMKSTLLKRLKESKVNNLKKIMMAEKIKDRKPSEFLQYLKDLAGQEVDEDYLKSVWSSGLPTRVQWVTSFLPSSSLDKIAQLADLAINSPSMKSENKSAVCNDDDDSETKEDDALKELIKRVETLSMKVEVLCLQAKKNQMQEVINNTQNRVNSPRAPNTYNNRPKRRLPETLFVCWYHAQFGWTATKCVHPCNFMQISLTLR